MTDERNNALEGNTSADIMEYYSWLQLDEAAALRGLLNGISSDENVILTPKQVTEMIVLIGKLVVYTTTVVAKTHHMSARECLMNE